MATTRTTVDGVYVNAESIEECAKKKTKKLPNIKDSIWFQKVARQELSAGWKPVPSIESTLCFFVLLTVVTMVLGAVFLRFNLKNYEIKIRYDDFILTDDIGRPLTNKERMEALWDKNTDNITNFEITITEKMENPVYLYYELENYFQNHKRYVRSLNEKQLGDGEDDASMCTDCPPYRYVGDEDKPSPNLPDNGLINPCGMIAHSYFNDTFTISGAWLNNGDNITIELKETGIATEWDRKYLYANYTSVNFNDDPNTRGGGTIEGYVKEDEHFMVWMRIGSLPTLRKLYGIIDQTLEKDTTLHIKVVNNYNTYAFNGKKNIVLSTANWTGSRNLIPGVFYLVIGILSALVAIIVMAWNLKVNRKFGDLELLSWKKNK